MGYVFVEKMLGIKRFCFERILVRLIYKDVKYICEF